MLLSSRPLGKPHWLMPIFGSTAVWKSVAWIGMFEQETKCELELACFLLCLWLFFFASISQKLKEDWLTESETSLLGSITGSILWAESCELQSTGIFELSLVAFRISPATNTVCWKVVWIKTRMPSCENSSQDLVISVWTASLKECETPHQHSENSVAPNTPLKPWLMNF